MHHLFPRLSLLLLSTVLLCAFACERAKPEKPADGTEPADDQKTPVPAMQPDATPDAKPIAKPAPKPISGEAKGTFYFKIDFTVVRGLAVVQANVPKFRELAQKQGYLGRLIACGADPFTTMDRLTAVLPPKVRSHPAGAVTLGGMFDPAKIITCLEGEFGKEQYNVVTEGGTRWLKSPRMTLSLTSPGERLVRGVSRGWDKLDFPTELSSLEKRLPAGYALLVGAVGDIFPMPTGMKLMLVSFAPSGDSLELNGLLQFSSEPMAAAVYNALVSGLAARKNAVANAKDPKMQLAASLLGRLNLNRTGTEILVSAKVPYAELIQTLGLFQFKVKGTF
ncbi:hypothetical protein KJ975_08545 [Myxococcota bacterium]|nr:hypothetical protein [Myxococcota bacterium]